jgi:hypothetical protein
MRPAYSVTSAADTHSPHAMIIAVGYMRVPHWNIKRTASLWLKIREFLSHSITHKIHAVTQILGFHSGINHLPFHLLHKLTLLGNWLQTFRENVGVTFLKRSKCAN